MRLLLKNRWIRSKSISTTYFHGWNILRKIGRLDTEAKLGIDDLGHQGKLAAEKGSTLTRVQVDTNRGVVQLSGVVDSAADRSLAERVTRGVSGVKGVTNNLQVK